MMAICMADGQMVKRPSRDLCHAATPIACNRCFPDLRPEFFTLAGCPAQGRAGGCATALSSRRSSWPSATSIGACRARNASVIPNGQVHPAPGFDRRQHSAQVNRFGFFGQFIDNKGIDVILEALIILGKENRMPACGIVLDINGGNEHYATPAYLAKIHAQMSELQTLKVGPLQVRSRGRYTRDQLADRMKDVDWVIAPSTWWEVFGLVVSEAWMFGRPVIVSNIGGLGERVSDGVDGFRFPVRDAMALANLLVSILGNERRWSQLQDRLKQPLNSEEMLELHLRLWKELAVPPIAYEQSV